MNAVEIKNFSTGYGKQAVLKNLDLGFQDTRITAIMGPSGCGKTTLLRSINRTAELEKGFNRQGSIELFGQPLYDSQDLSAIRRKIGMVYQTPVALPLSIRENVLFGPKYYGVKARSEQDQIVESCLRKTALWDEVKDRLKQSAAQLSGGQKQRLAIARVLAVEPRVLLLDEPCSSLDPTSTALIEDLLIELARELCIIIVTHNLFQARRIAHESIFMLDGQLVERGATESLFASPIHARTRDFVSGLFG